VSGGSYNYLFAKDCDMGLFTMEAEIEQMAERLAGLGYAEDAARETEEVLLIIRQAKVRIETRQERLRNIWHAVEWWDSADSGEDRVQEAIAAYRGETE
jgi:hypothetical protein